MDEQKLFNKNDWHLNGWMKYFLVVDELKYAEIYMYIPI